MLKCENIKQPLYNADGLEYNLEIPEFTVQAGQVIIIEGDDEKGKDALLTILAGINHPLKGSVLINEQSPFLLNHASRHQLVNYYGTALPVKNNFTLQDNLTFLHADETLQQDRIIALFERFGFDYESVIEENYGNLSEQQQDIFRLINCFVSESKLYVLHHPFIHLSSETITQLCDFLAEYFDKAAIIITHQAGEPLPVKGISYRLTDGILSSLEPPQDDMVADDVVMDEAIVEPPEEPAIKAYSAPIFDTEITPEPEVPSALSESESKTEPEVEVETEPVPDHMADTEVAPVFDAVDTGDMSEELLSSEPEMQSADDAGADEEILEEAVIAPVIEPVEEAIVEPSEEPAIEVYPAPQDSDENVSEYPPADNLPENLPDSLPDSQSEPLQTETENDIINDAVNDTVQDIVQDTNDTMQDDLDDITEDSAPLQNYKMMLQASQQIDSYQAELPTEKAPSFLQKLFSKKSKTTRAQIIADNYQAQPKDDITDNSDALALLEHSLDEKPESISDWENVTPPAPEITDDNVDDIIDEPAPIETEIVAEAEPETDAETETISEPEPFLEPQPFAESEAEITPEPMSEPILDEADTNILPEELMADEAEMESQETQSPDDVASADEITDAPEADIIPQAEIEIAEFAETQLEAEPPILMTEAEPEIEIEIEAQAEESETFPEPEAFLEDEPETEITPEPMPEPVVSDAETDDMPEEIMADETERQSPEAQPTDDDASADEIADAPEADIIPQAETEIEAEIETNLDEAELPIAVTEAESEAETEIFSEPDLETKIETEVATAIEETSITPEPSPASDDTPQQTSAPAESYQAEHAYQNLRYKRLDFFVAPPSHFKQEAFAQARTDTVDNITHFENLLQQVPEMSHVFRDEFNIADDTPVENAEYQADALPENPATTAPMPLKLGEMS